MIELYRLEFSEKQQWLRMDHGNSIPGTNGFITITDYCSDQEFEVFESYLNRTEKKVISNEYVLKSFSELKGFLKNLHEYGMMIRRE